MLAKGSARASAHEYDDLIRQVADSETFRSAPTMRALLLYLWEHQGEPISEYAIATFNRDVYLSKDAGRTWTAIAARGETK